MTKPSASVVKLGGVPMAVCAVDRVGRVVGADRAVVAEGGAALPYPGRKRLPDRQALQGILFVLHTGIEECELNE